MVLFLTRTGSLSYYNHKLKRSSLIQLNMNNHINTHALKLKGRILTLPCNVTIKTKEKTFEVTATKAFKISPKKRIVCSGNWGKEKIVMKFFLESLRASHYFKKELKGLKALKRAGIRTPDIVFCGVVENTKIKVIATKEILPASDMMSVWNSIKENAVYADLQKQIIHKIAVIHNAGLKQDDLHLGNFLISKNRIYTIDGDGVDASRKGPPLSEKLSLENVSILFSQFYPTLDKISRISLEYYAECRGWTDKQGYIPGLFDRIKPRIQKIRSQKLKKYLKKIFRDCSEFFHKKNWGMELVCDRKAFDAGLKKFLDTPDRFINKGKILKTEKNSIITQIEIDSTSYVVKTYTIKNIAHFSEKYLKKTRARLSWHNAHLLKQLGTFFPHPLCFMEERSGPICLKAYFVVEFKSDHEPEKYAELFLKLEKNRLNPE